MWTNLGRYQFPIDPIFWSTISYIEIAKENYVSFDGIRVGSGQSVTLGRRSVPDQLVTDMHTFIAKVA